MTPTIDVNSLLILASPFLGTTGIQHIVAALKGTIPSRFLPLAALACGVMIGWICAVAFGYINGQGIAMFTLIGLLAGADASAGASAIKTADREMTTTTVELQQPAAAQADVTVTEVAQPSGTNPNVRVMR